MSQNIVGPFGAGINPATVRPDDPVPPDPTDTWFSPCVGGDPNTGTKVTAVWLNKVTALFRHAIRGMGVTDLATDDDMLLKAIQHADRGLENIGSGDGAVYKGIGSTSGKYGLRNIKAGTGMGVAVDDSTGDIVLTSTAATGPAGPPGVNGLNGTNFPTDGISVGTFIASPFYDNGSGSIIVPGEAGQMHQITGHPNGQQPYMPKKYRDASLVGTSGAAWAYTTLAGTWTHRGGGLFQRTA